MDKLTHLDDLGRAQMVDVTGKNETVRTARAVGFVRMASQVLDLIRQGKIAKGNPLETARIAGILAAKNTAQILPLCHPLPLTHVNVQCQILEEGISIEASATAVGRTGVEMEALTAVAVASLTVYDMCKAADKNILISNICLVEKTGGRSGHYRRVGNHPED